jgi:hypothetical protein
MQKKVVGWQSEVADKEVLCAYYHVKSDDIADQLGPLGAAAWDELVTNEQPETILRGSKAYIEASDIRRPNKAKDAADLQAMQQFLLPVFAGDMAQTGDVGPLNGFIQAMGDASEIDVSHFLFPEKPPNEIAQQAQVADVEKVKAETEKLKAEAQCTLQEHEGQQQEAQMKMQVAEHGAQIKQQESEQKLQLQAEEAKLKQQTKLQELALKGEQHQMTMQQKREQAQQDLAMKLMENVQGARHKEDEHQQGMRVRDEQAESDAQRGNLITAQKMLSSRAEHSLRMQQMKEKKPETNNG